VRQDSGGGPAERYERTRRPQKCPSCGSQRVGTILRGTPALSDELEADIDAGRVIIGGCCVSDEDPTWACADCGADIHKEN
jgi:hypothetical protein